MEIEFLVGQVREMDSEFADDPELIEALKNKS